jgi:hypothetical protein
MLCLGDGCIVIENVVIKKQCKFLTLYDFLTVLFAALLLTDERDLVVSAAGQKSICRLQYCGLRDSPKIAF